MKSTARIKTAEVVRERHGCRNGYCGIYLVGGTENTRAVVAEMRSAISKHILFLRNFCLR